MTESQFMATEPRGFDRNQFKAPGRATYQNNQRDRDNDFGFLHTEQNTAPRGSNISGRASYREKPKIFQNRTTEVNHEVLTKLERKSSPHTKLRPVLRAADLEETDDSLDAYSNFDLNDPDLLRLIKEENKGLKKEVVADESESVLGLKEQIKGHSARPLNVSNRHAHIENKSPRASMLGRTSINASRPSATGRPSAGRVSYNAHTVAKIDTGDSIAQWFIKRAPTEQEEDDDDDRGGLFCGICTSRKKKKASNMAPEINKRKAPLKLTAKDSEFSAYDA